MNNTTKYVAALIVLAVVGFGAYFIGKSSTTSGNSASVVGASNVITDNTGNRIEDATPPPPMMGSMTAGQAQLACTQDGGVMASGSQSDCMLESASGGSAGTSMASGTGLSIPSISVARFIRRCTNNNGMLSIEDGNLTCTYPILAPTQTYSNSAR